MPKAGLIAKFMKNAKGFDTILNKVKYLTADNGSCLASIQVEQEHTNVMGGLHGGFSATLVDCISSMALFTHKVGERPSVSVNINLVYLKGAKVGDEILIDCKTLRAGKTLAFMEVEIRNKLTNDILVKAEHTKFFMSPPTQ